MKNIGYYPMIIDKARKRAELTLLKGDVLLTLRDIAEH